jgi:iron complex outermembrane recepter protein
MFKRSKISSGVLLALGGVLLVPVAAIAQESQRIEVTGSRIKRIDAETASPVQRFSREDIQRSGAANVNDLLQRITGAGAAIDDRITNGFAPGGGGLNLRNLGFNSTLVLVDGRRVATYPFGQQLSNGTQGFNDLQNIPIAMVERLEVLKDGASAIYGADAVGGVVNIITRTAITGFEIGASYGTSQERDGNTVGFNIATGFEAGSVRAALGGTILKRDSIKSRDRSWAGTEDLRNRGGSDRRSAYGFPGTILDNEVEDNVLYDVGGTCGPTEQIGGSSIARGACRYDRPTLGSLYPESTKTGIVGNIEFAFTPNVSAFAQLMFTRNAFKSTGWPAGTTDDTGIGSDQIPAGSPVNPFSNQSSVLYRFADVGNRGDDGKTDTTRLVLGAKGATFGWDWEGAANLNRVNIDTKATNNTLTTRLMCLLNPGAAADYAAGGNPLGLGTIGTGIATGDDTDIFLANPSYGTYFRNQLANCGDAFAQYGYYNFVDPSQNAPGVAAYLRHDSKRTGRSRLNGFDFRASRELTQLGGGGLGLALGAETRKEKISDVPDEQLQTGDTLSISAAQAFGERRASAVFAEVNAPFTKQIEANFAVRHDKYSGNGKFSSTSPKLGLRWAPVPEFIIRSTASRAFRAPSLFETTPAQQTSFTFGIQDPVLCPEFDDTNPDCVLDVRQVQRGNPNLKAERSRVFTLGLVFEPSPVVSLSIDYFRIKRSDEIGTFVAQDLVDLFPNDPSIVVRDQNGRISQINTVPIQLNGTRTNGVDAEIQLRHDLGNVGRLSSKVGVSYVSKYEFTTVDSSGGQVLENFNGTYNQPRWRANWDFALNRGSWEVSLGGYAIGRYEGLGRTESVAPEVIWNAGLQYTGVKNLTLQFQVNDLLNRGPSFNDETSGSNAGYNAQYGDPIGRFFTIKAQYKF